MDVHLCLQFGVFIVSLGTCNVHVLFMLRHMAAIGLLSTPLQLKLTPLYQLLRMGSPALA